MSKAAVTTSRRPYLLRAMHEWMTDNLQTPHIVVDATLEGVQVPRQYVQDGKIVLNVSLHATQSLNMGNAQLEFNARFGGQTFHVIVPMTALLGIYARETGQGMIFGEEDSPPPVTPPDNPPDGPPDSPPSADDKATAKVTRLKPQLKVVK